MNPDIFNVDNLESVVRNVFKDEAKEGKIRLTDFNDEKFSIPDYCKKQDIKLKTGEVSEMRKVIGKVSEVFEKKGYSGNIFTAIYEAVLNAFQHGNEKQPNKKITIGYNMDEKGLDIYVEDQGGYVNPSFIPFILRHRECKKDMIDFYEFSNTPKPEVNCGTGTSFMHQYVDNVSYHISKEGGLIVHLRKESPKEPEKSQ